MTSGPWYLSALVVIGIGLILFSTARELRNSAKAAGMGDATATRVTALFAAGYTGWIVLTAALAATHVYRMDKAAITPWLLAGFAVPLAVLLLLARLPVAARILSGPHVVARLARPHEVRIVGVIFLLALVLGLLPPAFALPAALGDIAIGLTARRVSRGLLHGDGKRRAIWFNLLGIADFVTAFTIAFLGGPGSDPILHLTPTTQYVSTLPLALIPTAGVPLLFALHILSLTRLRTTSTSTTAPVRPIRTA
ncbi:hypothetical protein Athai_14830 [Actinocatenispora thailandica]|uniref:Uncharacterized protein n=1 Tax=Actinocatenispora thailandica TaxID=227318 RepID=A0A7R7DLZ0_9ACTN|nr:hypothetical protein [Actinocatenispora thailandica]BCJ33980.1 hypothetical protein Athai_14830 [Actinocatenispora thailandica]